MARVYCNGPKFGIYLNIHADKILSMFLDAFFLPMLPYDILDLEINKK
jgi:hypothetical protein